MQDTGDFPIIGVSWGKTESAGRFSTFHVGCLENKDDLMACRAALPHFVVLFSVECGLNDHERSQLTIAMKPVCVPFEEAKKEGVLPYTFEFRSRTGDVDFMLSRPHVFELCGDSFFKVGKKLHSILWLISCVGSP